MNSQGQGHGETKVKGTWEIFKVIGSKLASQLSRRWHTGRWFTIDDNLYKDTIFRLFTVSDVRSMAKKKPAYGHTTPK